MGSLRVVELILNESGAPPLTFPGQELLGFRPLPGFGCLGPSVRSRPRGGGGVGAANVGGGGASARPRDMAHNKIPPRWLNCPRRGQPVAGNPDGGGGRVPAYPRARGWAV